MIYQDVVPVIQDVPIISDKEIAPLKKIKFTSMRGKSPNTRVTTQDLYTANDTEFMKWLAMVTKTKIARIMATVEGGMVENGGWTNVNRLRRRINLIKRFRKSINRYLKTLDTK